MSIFQRGNFKLHSGNISPYKIECDNLDDEDISTIALMLSEKLPPFGEVEGVPRGGLRLAEALRPYKTCGPLLIVDDVTTTGKSLESHRNGREAIGAVIFSRGYCPKWVIPLFESGKPLIQRLLELTNEEKMEIFRDLT